jgi:signal peptidase I
MNKWLNFFIFFIAIFIGVWILCRATNMLNIYKSPTPANYPSFLVNESFFISNLKTPKRLDFICYNTESPETGKYLSVKRLCAMENDIVEIRAGVLFVNNKNMDKGLSLGHNYHISKKDFEIMIADIDNINTMSYDISQDSLLINYADTAIKNLNVKVVKEIMPVDFNNEEIFKQFGFHWNQDNFGPIVVPKDKYFVMGDNRSNALDSRYSGFVSKSDYVATVLNK